MFNKGKSEFETTADHAEDWLKKQGKEPQQLTSRGELSRENDQLDGKLFAEYEVYHGEAGETVEVFPYPQLGKNAESGKSADVFLIATKQGFLSISVDSKKIPPNLTNPIAHYISSTIKDKQRDANQNDTGLTFGYENGALQATLGGYSPKGKFSMGLQLIEIDPSEAETIISLNREKATQELSPKSV